MMADSSQHISKDTPADVEAAHWTHTGRPVNITGAGAEYTAGDKSSWPTVVALVRSARVTMHIKAHVYSSVLKLAFHSILLIYNSFME